MKALQNINRPTPTNVAKLIAILMVIQQVVETSADPIPYSGYIKSGLALLVGCLAVFTGTKE